MQNDMSLDALVAEVEAADAHGMGLAALVAEAEAEVAIDHALNLDALTVLVCLWQHYDLSAAFG